MSSAAHQTRLLDTCRQEITGYIGEVKPLEGELCCMVCGWSGGHRDMHVTEGQVLRCPNCRDDGKIETASDIREFLKGIDQQSARGSGYRYILGRYTRDSIEGWRKTRKARHLQMQPWQQVLEKGMLTAQRKGKGGDDQ